MQDIIFENLITDAYNQGIEKFVVGIFVYSDDHILLLQRLAKDTYPNMFEIPGGEVEKNEPLDSAVKRELHEETGLELLEIKGYEGHFDYHSTKGKKVRQFNFLVHTKGINIRWHPEHQQYRWINNKNIDKFPMTKEMYKTASLFFNK